MQKLLHIIYITLLLGTGTINNSTAQVSDLKTTTYAPVAVLDQPLHDFGQIYEEDEYASHTFKIKNEGNQPLVITHVQSSCGCTEPQWTKTPIPPGDYGNVEITYGARRRPGPFRKNVMIYTNDVNAKLRVTIMGDVVPESNALDLAHNQPLGSVIFEKQAFDFDAVTPHNVLKQEIWVRNVTDYDIDLNVDAELIGIKPETVSTLRAGKAAKLKLTVDVDQLHTRKGRIATNVEWHATHQDGKTENFQIPVTLSLIDDFSKWTEYQLANPPVVAIPNTLINYNPPKKAKSKKRIHLKFAVLNTGITPLNVYSVSCDDINVAVSDSEGFVLQPNDSRLINVILPPKARTEHFDVFVVTNDPNAPVRQVKISPAN